MEERIVDKWLDELSYEDYKRQGLLAWQTEEDAKYEQAKLQKATGLHSSSPIQVSRARLKDALPMLIGILCRMNLMVPSSLRGEHLLPFQDSNHPDAHAVTASAILSCCQTVESNFPEADHNISRHVAA